jgi:hypothetical protein
MYFDEGRVAAPWKERSFPTHFWFAAALCSAATACSDAQYQQVAKSDPRGSVPRALDSITMGDATIEATVDSGNAGLLLAQSATLTQAGTLRSLSFYVEGAPAGHLRLGVYSNAADAPGNLLASTASTEAASGWNTIDVITPVALAAGAYWLAYEYDDAGLSFRSVGNGSSQAQMMEFTYGALPASFQATSSWNGNWSFYATLSGALTATTLTVTPPTASPASPVNPGTSVTFSATPTVGPNPIASVAYMNGSTVLCAATASPWSCSWSSVVGSYVIVAIASDNQTPPNSATSTGALSFTVDASAVTAPSVSTPTASAASPTPAGTWVTFSATPTAGTYPIASVAYLNGGTVLCTASASPWSCRWSSTTGSYTVRAIASDDRTPANTGTSSSSLALTVTAASGVTCVTALKAAGSSYFVDQNGNPKLILGDECWGLPSNAGRWGGTWQSDFDGYLTARQNQGVNVLYTQMLGTTILGGVSDDCRTWDGVKPFALDASGAYILSTLNETFWQRADYLISHAAARGITVFLNLGSNGAFGTTCLGGSHTTTDWRSYGAAMGNRYKSSPNIIWMIQDDYAGGLEDANSAILSGLRSTGDVHPISIENNEQSTSRTEMAAGGIGPTVSGAWGANNAQFNFVYSYMRSYFNVEYAYSEPSPMTVIQGDGPFYDFSTDQFFRSWLWWAYSSGARGVILGSANGAVGYVWQWASGSLAQVQTGDTFFVGGQANQIRAAVEGISGWQNLLPDLTSQLVTAGRGTRYRYDGIWNESAQLADNYVTASLTSDGSLALIYMSHASAITIDESKVGGAGNYNATRLDPASGTKTSVTAGTSYNSGSWGSNSAGGADWVLVLQHK